MASRVGESPGRLSWAIDQYLASMRVKRRQPNTIKNHTQTLNRFLSTTGNLLVKNIDERHVINFFAEAGRTRQASSLNVHRSVLNTFFKWCRRSRLMPPDSDPMWDIEAFEPFERERKRVHVSDFPRLLDAAEQEHKRDRIMIALGLYLFLRQSEMATLTIGRLDLKGGSILVRVQKTKKDDLMPIPKELDEELREWLEFYTWDVGEPLRPEWPLIPHKRKRVGVRPPGSRFIQPGPVPRPQLDPSQPLRTHLEKVAKAALRKIDFPVDDSPEGTLKGEGMHTLRRSGARAWYDELQAMEPWVDPATGRVVRPVAHPIRPVQAALHHKTQMMTEHYIGCEPDRLDRDLLMRGRYMYPSLRAKNVVELRAYGGDR